MPWRSCVCPISTPGAMATAAAPSSTIPAPGPWLIPLIPGAEEAPDLDHSKEQGNPRVRSELLREITRLLLGLSSDADPQGQGQGQRGAGQQGAGRIPDPAVAFIGIHAVAPGSSRC